MRLNRAYCNPAGGNHLSLDGRGRREAAGEGDPAEDEPGEAAQDKRGQPRLL